MAKWYAGAIIFREEDGVRKYLVIDTRSTNPRYAMHPFQTKFIGGTEEFHEDEDKTVLDTLRRELAEETDMEIRPATSQMMIHTHSIPGHFKNFYEVPWSDLVRELRTVDKTVEGDWMSAPYWVTFEEAKRRLYGTHQPALLKSEDRYQAKFRAA